MNPFCGKSQEWLEAEYEKAIAAHAGGGSIISTSAGDVSVTRQSDVKSDIRVRQILLALHRKDPEKWTAEDCVPKTETRVAFRGALLGTCY